MPHVDLIPERSALVINDVDQGWGAVSEDEVRKSFFSTWQKAFARLMTAAEALAESKVAA